MLVRRTINILLTRNEVKALPATYDRISRACRAVVDEAGKGEGLYDAVKIALEQCVKDLAEELNNDARKSVEWLVPFTDVCAWYEKQVVSDPRPSSRPSPSSVLSRVCFSPSWRT